MPGKDPEITQHDIDTHAHMVPVKQKLKRMKAKWLLVIKERVTKQLKVGFIKPLHQAKWIANVTASFWEVCHSLTGVVGFSHPYSMEFQTLLLIDFKNAFVLTFQ